jgi:hypothetical protein
MIYLTLVRVWRRRAGGVGTGVFTRERERESASRIILGSEPNDLARLVAKTGPIIGNTFLSSSREFLGKVGPIPGSRGNPCANPESLNPQA